MEDLFERLRNATRCLKESGRALHSDFSKQHTGESLRRAVADIKRLEDEQAALNSRQSQLEQLFRELDSEANARKEIFEQVTRERELQADRLNTKRRILAEREADLLQQKSALEQDIAAVQQRCNDYVKVTGLRISSEDGDDGHLRLRLVFNENELGSCVLELRDDILLTNDEKSLRWSNKTSANMNNTTLQNVGLSVVEGFRLVRCDPPSCADAIESVLTALNADKCELVDFIKEVRTCMLNHDAARV